MGIQMGIEMGIEGPCPVAGEWLRAPEPGLVEPRSGESLCNALQRQVNGALPSLRPR
jgi:hypothetical protein